jgi:hypothetical protein
MANNSEGGQGSQRAVVPVRMMMMMIMIMLYIYIHVFMQRMGRQNIQK